MIGKVTSRPGRPHPDACPACDGFGRAGSRVPEACQTCGGSGLACDMDPASRHRCQGCGDWTGMACVALCAACRRELAEWHGQTPHDGVLDRGGPFG